MDAHDVDPRDTLNTTTGTIHLPTGERMNNFFPMGEPIVLGVDDGECPGWMRFLHESMGGSKREGSSESVECIRRILGYMLTGRIDEQLGFAVTGEGHGKTVFINIVKSMMRTYVVSTPTISSSREWGHVFATAEKCRMLSLGGDFHHIDPYGDRLLAMVGGDPICAFRLRSTEATTYVPQFKVFLVDDQISRASTHSGLSRRFVTLKFDERLKRSSMDPRLIDKLTAEIPQILSWAIGGARAWYEKPSLRSSLTDRVHLGFFTNVNSPRGLTLVGEDG